MFKIVSFGATASRSQEPWIEEAYRRYPTMKSPDLEGVNSSNRGAFIAGVQYEIAYVLEAFRGQAAASEGSSND